MCNKKNLELENQNSQRGFTCPFENCGQFFQYESHFQRHMNIHNNVRPFICDICNKGFKRQDALKVHQRQHNNNLIYKCTFDQCNKSFPSKASLRYHVLKHKNENTYECEYEGCNKSFLTLAQLKQHQRTKKHQNNLVQNVEQQSLDEEESPIVEKHILNKRKLQLSSNSVQKEPKIEKKSQIQEQNIQENQSKENILEIEQEQQQQNEEINKNPLHQEENQQNGNDLDESSKCKYGEILEGQDIYQFDDYHREMIQKVWDREIDYGQIEEPDSMYGKFRQELYCVVGIVDKITRKEEFNEEKLKTALTYVNINKFENNPRILCDTNFDVPQNQQQMFINSDFQNDLIPQKNEKPLFTSSSSSTDINNNYNNNNNSSECFKQELFSGQNFDFLSGNGGDFNLDSKSIYDCIKDNDKNQDKLWFSVSNSYNYLNYFKEAKINNNCLIMNSENNFPILDSHRSISAGI